MEHDRPLLLFQLLIKKLETSAVVTWNTIYMEAVIEQLASEGHLESDEDINRLLPTRYE